MTLRFVKTSILSSNDGIDFGNEVSVESEEVLKTRLAAEQAANKPLYQQLADLRDQKQLEYDENTKKIFAPPKGLDEEDIEFFNELDNAKAKQDDTVKRHEESELEAFREARRLEMLKEHNPKPAVTIKLPERKVETSINIKAIVKAKRKISSNAAENTSATKKKASETTSGRTDDGDAVINTTSSSTNTTDIGSIVKTAAMASTTTSSLFADYDSD